jgi:hypothetical protein
MTDAASKIHQARRKSGAAAPPLESSDSKNLVFSTF